LYFMENYTYIPMAKHKPKYYLVRVILDVFSAYWQVDFFKEIKQFQTMMMPLLPVVDIVDG